MSYPIPLNRYQKVRSQVLRAESDPGDLLALGEDPTRWEILGVASSRDAALMVLGMVREGLALQDESSE
jgi:hypothetical protein